MNCKHNMLEILQDVTPAVDVEVRDTSSGVVGMFMYKKYQCKACECIITVLQAVVEETDKYSR